MKWLKKLFQKKEEPVTFEIESVTPFVEIGSVHVGTNWYGEQTFSVLDVTEVERNHYNSYYPFKIKGKAKILKEDAS